MPRVSATRRLAAGARATFDHMTAGDLIIVANRLPIELAGEDDGLRRWQRSPGGLVSALESALSDRRAVWIGWAGTPSDAGSTDTPPIPTRTSDNPYDLVEVPLTGDEVRHFYDGFSNSALWPLYHDAIAPPAYHRIDFDAYRRVNLAFARAAAVHALPGATVWIHDYQLQLVPALLRDLRPDLRIGFFLHIPFPAPDLFMQLPWRRELISGLLGADLVGFQTSGGARNFLACARRLLAWPVYGDRIRLAASDGRRRDCLIGSFGISVDWPRIDRIARQPETVERARRIRAELGNPDRVLLGVDRLDYTKGIDVRLRAYTELLRERRLDPDHTVLIQVATPSRENVDEYQRIRDDVELIVSRTNGDLGQIGAPAIHYLRQNQPLTELIALYRAADVMLVTPLRDGMNLVSKEYVASRADDDGALVLSEFTGAARELSAAWLLNPHDTDGMKDAIVAAAHADPLERRRRMRALRSRVRNHDVEHWTREFLTTLAHVTRDRKDEREPRQGSK